ncbi:AAEL005658-PA [Aedes aegypti]|uniref:AAEL005658-PA n=1 Tax=Aedes aegypti TaxID=7159 RepID=Q179G4_AEDAE|nr:AAEL005658-PA [Aedes aegypti]
MPQMFSAQKLLLTCTNRRITHRKPSENRCLTHQGGGIFALKCQTLFMAV